MTFLKERLTNRDLLAKSIRNESKKIRKPVHLSSNAIKASDLQWKHFYENMFLFGGVACCVLSVLLIFLLPFAATSFFERILVQVIITIVGFVFAFVMKRRKALSNVSVLVVLILLGVIMLQVLSAYNSIALSLKFASIFALITLLSAIVTRYNLIYILTILAVDVLIALMLSNYLYFPDYVIAYLLLLFNALILCSFLFINHIVGSSALFPKWFISTLLFSFNSFNIYYLYLVNSHLSNILNIICILINIVLMMFYLYVFNNHKNLINYTIVVLSCFFGAFLTLFKFSTSFYSYFLCTTLLIVALNSVVEYLFNLQSKWRSLGV